MLKLSYQRKRLLYLPHSSELLRRFPTVFAFHPSVCLFEKQLIIHLAADRTSHIVLIHAFTSVSSDYSALMTCLATP